MLSKRFRAHEAYYSSFGVFEPLRDFREVFSINQGRLLEEAWVSK